MTDNNNATSAPDMKLFWGCFIALITTAFGFITRMFLLDDPEIVKLLKLDEAQVGRFKGIQVWPFALSIIIFSLIIDRVGYKFSMIFAFACQAIWAVMGFAALKMAGENPEQASNLIFWGGLILALGNGTVEAFINPVVATMFDKDKTKWLNILHAGWPGGLVIAGIITIMLGSTPWEIKLATIAIPAVIYFLMLIKCEFPVQERVSAGVSYRDMLAEFGVLGAIIVSILLTLQLIDFFPTIDKNVWIGLGAVMVVAFGAYTKSMGSPILFVLILIMMPLATTEIGTDGWISGIMASVVSFDGGWILVYTSVIMMVLRFYAGPIVHKLSPLGLLTTSAVLAIVGLIALSGASGTAIIFGAATLYALGKTFFWPTMLGVVSEQTPKGGALTLNAISGIGMLAVGVLGFPYIGVLQTETAQKAIVEDAEVQKQIPGLVEDGKVTTLDSKKLYYFMGYEAINDDKVEELIKKLPDEAAQKKATEDLKSTRDASKQKALAGMAKFPIVMLIAYICLILYFNSKGGYKPIDLGSSGDKKTNEGEDHVSEA